MKKSLPVFKNVINCECMCVSVILRICVREWDVHGAHCLFIWLHLVAVAVVQPAMRPLSFQSRQ